MNWLMIKKSTNILQELHIYCTQFHAQSIIRKEFLKTIVGTEIRMSAFNSSLSMTSSDFGQVIPSLLS